jgi:hypothetical protein
MLFLDNIFIGKRLVGLVVFGVLQQHLVHVRAGVLIQLIAAAEDDEGDLAVAQNWQLVGFLHHAELPLVESDLSIPFVGDSRYLNFFATHGSNFESLDSKPVSAVQCGNSLKRWRIKELL